jgi:putative ABC transport system permease protein
MNIVLKTALAPEALAGPMKRMVQTLDPAMPVSNIASMRQLTADSIQQARFSAVIVGLFAAIALLLAAVGIYGVMSYLVAQRTAEIGVRLALGAAERQIFGLVLADALRLTGIGVALGAAGALALGRTLRRLLFGVGAADPMTFLSTAAVLVAVAVLATYLPARRAMRVDPIEALRAE